MVHNVNVFERSNAGTPGTEVGKVHFLLGVHLVPFFPICYQRAEAVDPFEGDDARMCLDQYKIIVSFAIVGELTSSLTT